MQSCTNLNQDFEFTIYVDIISDFLYGMSIKFHVAEGSCALTDVCLVTVEFGDRGTSIAQDNLHYAASLPLHRFRGVKV